MKLRNFIAPLLVAGGSALAITVAPLAEAAQTCTATETSSVCESAGNTQVSATPPPVDYQVQYPFFGGYGLLFHGGGHR